MGRSDSLEQLDVAVNDADIFREYLIKRFGLNRENIYLRLDEQATKGEFDKVFSSGQLILGKNVKSLESNFSKYLNIKYGIGVNSGTDAIQIALMSAKIGKGDEVITVPNTAVPTVSAIVSCGAKPVAPGARNRRAGHP